MNQDSQTRHLLSKLQQVFRDGYRPARGDESYQVKLKHQYYAYDRVNCFGHIFNLRNQQFNDYQIKPYELYGNFFDNNRSDLTQNLFDFVRATGLTVEPCAPGRTITDFQSWKIALYLDFNTFDNDFHFLLEDAPHKWSSKIGFSPYVEHLKFNLPPKEYRQTSMPNPRSRKYQFYGTYKITNPNADLNNPYVQDRIR